jgi:C1A family cysteine protease
MPNRLYPVKPDSRDTRDHIAAPPPPDSQLPPYVNLLPWLGPVTDQGQTSSCTAHAGCGLREYLYRRYSRYEKAKQLGDRPVFSPLFLYYMERQWEGDPQEDQGAESRTIMQVMAKMGVCLESSDRFNAANLLVPPTPTQLAEALNFRIGAYHRVIDLPTLKSVLASWYVSCLAFTVYQSFESAAVDTTGLMPMPGQNESILGGHEVLAYGYSDKEQVVMCRNSWGKFWGNNGNFKMPYSFFLLPSDSGVMDMWMGHLGKPWKA